VRAGPAGQVSVTEHRNGFTDAIRTRYRQQGDVITVTVSIENGLPTATWVDFDVAVPQGESANVAVSAGTLTATGLRGDLGLDDTNGSIWATNVGGAITLRTTSGSVNTSRVDGQVSAFTGNGTITAVSTRLQGRSQVRAQSGTINFHGSLDPGCRAGFSNTSGAIGITLPAGSPVLVNARASHGSINSQFSSVRVATTSRGQVADGRIGQGDPARLNVRTTAGSIGLGH
jgi:hypothetical protein